MLFAIGISNTSAVRANTTELCVTFALKSTSTHRSLLFE